MSKPANSAFQRRVANDNAPDKRVVVEFNAPALIGRVEVEVFDLLFGKFSDFANDNLSLGPKPDSIRAPPAGEL